jgi:radical SAM superfamily enzyme YgiQ (UPF0313 family)
VLIEHGYGVHIIDVRQNFDVIKQLIIKHDPVLIGLSLIFQYFLDQYKKISQFIRSIGISCHITIGGHYPSLRYEKVLTEIPCLDSVVIFEGELTLLKLAKRITNNRDWKRTKGIAYVEKGNIIVNPFRALIPDLDQLPFPYRPFKPIMILGKYSAPIIASRGCVRNCAFCSIREFYGRAPGKIVRRRSPMNVVKEIKQLYDETKITIFLFQDDDFPIVGEKGRRWIYSFIDELKQQKLVGKVIWKISCRADEVDEDLFLEMKKAGLYFVYLGIESGTNEGLKVLKKQMTVEQILSAIYTLKKIDILFGYGFMLFDPSSTYDKIRSNVLFLKKIIGDGSAAAVFGRMLPYAGTSIEKSLSAEGRLRGNTLHPDYVFVDPSINRYYNILHDSLSSWISGPKSVSSQLDKALYEAAIIKRLFIKIDGVQKYEELTKNLVKKSNNFLLQIVEDSSYIFEKTGSLNLRPEKVKMVGDSVIQTLIKERNKFIYENQNILKMQI